MEWRGCASALGVIKLPSPVLVQNSLRNQFTHYYMGRKRVLGIINIKLHNFVVVATDFCQQSIEEV